MRSLYLAGVVAVGVLSGCGQSATSSEPLGKQQQALSTGLVISAIYGGGTGSTYKNDYVEIFNRGATPVSLTGLTLQYSRPDFPTWDAAGNVLALTGTIPAGGYYLVKYAANATGTTDLPTPELTGTTNYSGGGALVAIVTGSTPLDCGPALAVDGGADPDAAAPARPCTSATIIDFVGYGKTGATPKPAPVFEGASAAPTGAAASVIKRKGEGCTETDDNGNDFELVAFSVTVVPRNSASPLNPCGLDAGLDAAVDTAVADIAVDAVDAPIDAPIDAPVDAPADVTVDAGGDAKADAVADAPADTGTAPTDTGTESDTGSAIDTGTPVPPDTGTAATDTGTAPALDEVTDDGGCGCHVAGADRTSAAASLVGMFFALGAVARRRRR